MRLIGNILWHIPFLGFINAIFAFLLGLLLTALVITAPIGLGLMQYSKFLLAPFSYSMVSKNDLNYEQNSLWRAYSFIIMIIYFPLGLIFAFIALVQAVCLFCTIVGIPVAITIFKSLGTYLNPVGKVCVPYTVGQIVQDEKNYREADKYFNK